MNPLPIYQIDAFTTKLFGGNPAAVCPLESWLEDEVLQNIAAENNLSETAFVVPEGDDFSIRWFTPRMEVDLCGHATLASAHVIFNILGHKADQLVFNSKSGPLKVSSEQDLITLDFPEDLSETATPPLDLLESLGVSTQEVYRGKTDFMIVLKDQSSVEKIIPNFRLLAKVAARGIIVTAPGDEVDFVSRFFAPASGINEDPVTGSSHCTLTPYWSERLNKTTLTALQVSARGGQLYCQWKDDRVLISGHAVTYLSGTISIGQS